MLISLKAADAVKYFDHIWSAVASSLYCKVTDSAMKEKILQAVKEGKLLTWLGTRKDNTIVSIILTTFIYHGIDSMITLLVYAAYAAETTSPKEFNSIYKVLSQFAEESGCSAITYYTNNEKLVALAKRIHGHIEQYIMLPIIQQEITNGRAGNS